MSSTHTPDTVRPPAGASPAMMVALGLLAAVAVAGALWVPWQLWPTSKTHNGVHGLQPEVPPALGSSGKTLPAPAVVSAHPSTADGPAPPAVVAKPPPSVDEAATACALLQPRLPGVSRAQCLAAQLRASGALSREGTPLYWRDVRQPAVVAASMNGAGPRAEPLRVLVVGAIHGDELTAGSLALRWVGMAESESAGMLPGAPQRTDAMAATQPAPVHWRFIPVLNPDGLLAPKPTRVNAGGVDLNRNFPTPGWAHEAPVYWEQRTRKDPRRWPGHQPLSEPESRFLHRQIELFQPHLVVSIHAPYGVLDFDGPHDPPERLGRLRMDKLGVFPGSLGHYGGLHRGVPVVTIELTHALRMPPEDEVRAMWRDLRQWINTRLLAGGVATVAGPATGVQR